MKIDTILDKLLVFMKNEIEKKGKPIHLVTFDFKSNEADMEGEDLAFFKTQANIKNDGDIQQCLKKAMTNKYIKYQSQSDGGYKNLILTETGDEKAEWVKSNQKNKSSTIFKFIIEKLLVPIITAVLTSLIINYFNATQTDKQFKQLKDEIEWLKASQSK